jgi:hypothetical protein
VVDPLDVQQVQRLEHGVRVALLPRVGDEPQAFGRGLRVHLREQRGRVADLGGVEPDADELVPERQRRAEGLGGRVGTQVPQEAHDQVGGDPVRGVGVGQGGGQAAEHRGQRDPVVKVGLRVEEDLCAAYPGRGGPVQVRLSQIVEVLFGPQYPKVGVVQVQEGLQAVEPVAGPQFGGIRGRQRDAVARGQADEQFGFEGAFDVQMEFGHGQHARDCAARITVRSA